MTKIVHQSPQFILFVDGKPVYDVDNWNITPDALESALLKWLGPAPKKESSSSDLSKDNDAAVYIGLLEKFLSGSLLEQDFERQWLFAFQQDASLRSTRQFNLLNSLYGDVDAAIHHHHHGQVSKFQIAINPQDILRGKAQKLLDVLKSG